MNFIYLAGHLGSDAETRYTPNGQKVTTFRLATNSRKGGKDETVWWRVTIWGDKLDKLIPHLKKGSAVIVMGELNKPEIYQDKSGNPQVSLDVTAETIRFSPFGRGDRQEAQLNSEGGISSDHAFVGSQEGGRGHHSMKNFSAGIATGASSKSSDFSDDEIPF